MKKKTLAEMVAEAIKDEAKAVAADLDQLRRVARGEVDPAGTTQSDYTSEELAPETLDSWERVVTALDELAAFVRDRPPDDGRIGALGTHNLARAKGRDPEETWVFGQRVHVLLNGFRHHVGDQRSCDDMLNALVPAAREDFEHER